MLNIANKQPPVEPDFLKNDTLGNPRGRPSDRVGSQVESGDITRHVLCFVMNKQLLIHDKAIACS